MGMGQGERASHYLTQKMEIINKLSANTETQCRFIHKREMKGLGRVLREREVLLNELAMLNKELASDQTWEYVSAAASMIRNITDKQQELLERSKQVLQEAVAEHALIATELKSSKIRRHVKNEYVNTWTMISRRRLLNVRG
ncbi:MAG: hypothetical protein ABFC57_04525 [Veillonellales bacterium]